MNDRVCKQAFEGCPTNPCCLTCRKSESSESSELTGLLYAVVAKAKDVYGEPQYKYYKKNITWSGRGRNRYHVTPIGHGTEVSELEYLDRIEESKRNQSAAFMGELKRSYLRYEKEIVDGGWRSHLISIIKSI